MELELEESCSERDSNDESSKSEPPQKLTKRSSDGCALCGVTVSSHFRLIETQSYASLVKDYTLKRPDSKVICEACNQMIRKEQRKARPKDTQEVSISVLLYYHNSIYTKVFSLMACAGSILRHVDD